MKKVFLFGYYGFDNTGDEAILEAIIEQFKEVLPNTKLTALTYKAKDTIERYGINAVSRNNFKDIIKAIKNSDFVISGGGSLLQDVTSSRSLIYYLAIIYLAKKLGKKTMFYGNGFGPVTKCFNKKLVKYIINQVDIITVRDYESKEALKSLGIKKDITITADATFAMELPPERTIEEIYKIEKIDRSKKLIGVSVRRWYGENTYKNIIARICENLINKNYQVVFVPMQYPEDLHISMEIRDLMNEKPRIIMGKYEAREVIGIISGLDLLIGMRLHSLIFAATASVPMVGLEYDPKILSFLNLVGQKSGGKVDKLDMLYLEETLNEVINEIENYKQILNKEKNKLIEKSKLNIKILKEFIEEGEL